jgi:hypothetical protein
MAVLIVVAAVALAWCGARPAAAQNDGLGRRAPQGVRPGELQQLFDAMVLMRAQEALQLTDEQYPKFLTGLKSLQEARRDGEMQRNQIVQELRKLVMANDPRVEERMAERLSDLRELDERTAETVRRARAELDRALTVRQRALFQVFEEQMERQKLELLMRARQGNRPNRFQ